MGGSGSAGASTGRQTVVINARAAIRREIGGVERLAREMARRLPAMHPDRYRVVHPPQRLAHRAGHVWEQAALPLQARGAALIYSPANLAPLATRRNVLVIHDLAALRHPEAYSSVYVAYQRRLLPLLASRARLIVTVSEFSRRELVELLHLAPERVAVVPDGVDARFSPDADPAPARVALGLAGPYVLAVGTSSARKNLEALEPVARALAQAGIELVLAGSTRGYLRAGPAAAAPADLAAPRRLGYVPDALLPGLYAGARALVSPSRYEGFGLPCLEAMASGVPVVAARAGALPETVGESGLLVDPGDAAALTDGVLQAAHDSAVRSRLRAAGLERARRFSWERTARETDALLERLLSDT